MSWTSSRCGALPGKPGAWPDNPWGHEHPVIKVADKIFAFLGAGRGRQGGPNRDVADEWLQRYPTTCG